MNDTILRNAADPVTTEIVRNFVISCAEDMNASLWRSAHSAVIYEGRDSAVALLDTDGNMLGQSTGVPLFIGAIDANVHHVKNYYGDDIAQGDVFIMNDSYMQGSHLHDVTAVGPIFFDGELIGFGAARAHWNDIGAIDPGTVMGSTNIYQEGLRLGPTRIVAKGKPIREWFDLLRLNTRMPDASIGDLGAQIAASLRTKPQALAGLRYRDRLFPRTAYRRCWDALSAALDQRSACTIMVGLLWLAHDRACEAELAQQLDELLAADRLPDLKLLEQRFVAHLNDVPVVTVDIPGADSYDALFAARELAA